MRAFIKGIQEIPQLLQRAIVKFVYAMWLKSLVKFLGDSMRYCLRGMSILLFSLLLFYVVLYPFDLYLDLRETIVEWGKWARIVIKKAEQTHVKNWSFRQR